jgi:L-fucose isomerase-like protein
MNIAVFSLTSALHDEQTVSKMTEEFLGGLEIDYDWMGGDFTNYGSYPLSLIYVRTGGTEGLFQSLMPSLLEKTNQPFYLLASGKSNSLAASMEILSYLRQKGCTGEILHGQIEDLSRRICLLEKVQVARKKLRGSRLGIIGKPSDWLIASAADAKAVHDKLGIQLVDIPINRLLETLDTIPSIPAGESSSNPAVDAALPGAERIYKALKELVGSERLDGFTLRCFDLLSAVHNTGCLALAKLNAENVVAGCEGDVPAMLSMMMALALTGFTGFQANPASVDVNKGEVLFAHCTIPLNMVTRYEYDTHFESGIGVGIRGFMDEGPVTVFKLSGDLSEFFAAEGELLRCQANPNLCRTQLVVNLDEAEAASYFLTRPIGNHHIILAGRHKKLIEEMMKC